jgi:hypothetical protein
MKTLSFSLAPGSAIGYSIILLSISEPMRQISTITASAAPLRPPAPRWRRSPRDKTAQIKQFAVYVTPLRDRITNTKEKLLHAGTRFILGF